MKLKLLLAATTLFSFYFGKSQKTIMPHLNHTTVYVVDLKKSQAFYEKVMMLKKIAEPFHDGRHTWYEIAPHVQLHVVQGAQTITPHDVNIHLAFSVESLPEFIKHLEKFHVKYGNFNGVEKEIQKRPDGVEQIYLQDPDGYWIEVNNDKY